MSDNSNFNNAIFLENPSAQAGAYHSPTEALKVLFGYDSFRPGQGAVIDSILAGRDAFAVMPTGAGKSAFIISYTSQVMKSFSQPARIHIKAFALANKNWKRSASSGSRAAC